MNGPPRKQGKDPAEDVLLVDVVVANAAQAKIAMQAIPNAQRAYAQYLTENPAQLTAAKGDLAKHASDFFSQLVSENPKLARPRDAFPDPHDLDRLRSIY